jgi:phosphoenolpyruvate-protein kinase (PTS system EI component)
MFKKALSETVAQSELLSTLQGESNAYEGFIKQSIEDLKNTNAQALTAKQKTEALIANLTKTRDGFAALIAGNAKTIAELEKVFETATE